MPVASPHHPSLGLSLLKGALEREGVKADVRHFYLDFAEHVGLEAFSAISNDKYFLALVGEWLFSSVVHRRSPAEEMRYLSEVLLRDHGKHLSALAVSQILQSRQRIDMFLDYCVDAVCWSDYDIVGFSLCFQQTMASLALARRIRASHPHIRIVFGGANCEGEMGEELHRQYDFVDVVVAGEADAIIGEVILGLLGGRGVDAPGVITRQEEVMARPARQSVPVNDLDALPWADFSDFVRDRARTPTVSGAYQFVPLFESARGCWWGQTEHCTFCGLNALGMTFRSKDPDRAFREISRLADLYGPEILVVDNILDHKYFKTFLPQLVDREPPLLLHYEVKANLQARHLALLARAGVRKIQPGIESLSTRILKLMRKGITGLRNVQTLKLAAEAGVFVEWGHLYGFPGEQEQDYRNILTLVPALTHLSPPSSLSRVRADRFSPYFNSPEAFGTTIQPLPAYAHIYPFEAESLRRLAYHFEMTGFADDAIDQVHVKLSEALQLWSDEAGESHLTIDESGGHSTITDCRSCSSGSFPLSACGSEILRATAEIRSIEHVRALVSDRFTLPEIDDQIAELLDRRVLVREDEQLLSVALRQPGLSRAPRSLEIRTSLEQSHFFQVEVGAETGK